MPFELVYTSVAAEGLGLPELEHILVASRRRNIEMGITGVLLFSRGEFVQLLEGERHAVERLYSDFIAHDGRHASPTVAWTQDIEQRSFAQWAMGFSRGDGLAMATPGLEGYLAGGIAGLDLTGPASTGRKLLIAIHEQMRPRS